MSANSDFNFTEIKDIINQDICLLSKALNNKIKTQDMFLCYKNFYKINSEETIEFSKKLNSNEVQTEFPSIKNFDNLNVYKIDTDSLPSDKELLENGKIVTWKEIKNDCEFETYNEINLALQTNIGALKKQYAREDLEQTLLNYCKKNKIQIPIEGYFDPFIKKHIIDYCNKYSVTKLTIINEYMDEVKEINLAQKNIELIEINIKDYYIITENAINWTVGWDDFYYIITGDKNEISKFIEFSNIEGVFF